MTQRVMRTFIKGLLHGLGVDAEMQDREQRGV